MISIKNSNKRLDKYFIIIISIIIIFGFISNKVNFVNIINEITVVLTPFLIGIFIAYFMNFLVSKLMIKFKKMPKVIAMIIAYTIVLGIFSGIFILYIPMISQNIIDIINNVPTSVKNIIAILEKYNIDDSIALIDLDKTLLGVSNKIVELTPQIISSITEFGKSIFDFILGIIISIYILCDKDKIKRNSKRMLYAYLNKEKANNIINRLRFSEYTLRRFLIGKIIDSLIIGIICFIMLSIFRIDYAFLLSIFVGVTNIIPYFGPFVGAGIGAILLLAVNPSQTILFLILILILQQFDGNILGPKILGDKLGISTLWVLVGIIIGGAIAGFTGMLFGVPIVTIISEILNNDIDAKLNEKEIDIDNINLKE